jgi:hypothetical protein
MQPKALIGYIYKYCQERYSMQATSSTLTNILPVQREIYADSPYSVSSVEEDIGPVRLPTKRLQPKGRTPATPDTPSMAQQMTNLLQEAKDKGTSPLVLLRNQSDKRPYMEKIKATGGEKAKMFIEAAEKGLFGNQIVTKHFYEKWTVPVLREMLAKNIGQPGEKAPAETTGTGFAGKPKKISKAYFSGKGAPRGLVNPVSTNGLYYLDMVNLKKGILCIKYSTSRNYKMPRQNISSDCKALIELGIEGKFNEKLYKMIDESDRLHFDTCSDTMGWEHCQIDRSASEALYTRFETLRAEIQNGNDNPKTKSELRRVILELINNGRIPRLKGYSILYEMSL